jgi:hypothetical protein
MSLQQRHQRIFGRDIPQSAPAGGFTIRFVNDPLTNAMVHSYDDNLRQAMPSQAILLDEINLVSSQLLEILEIFMLEMSRSCRFSLPKGQEVSHYLIVVATIGHVTLSNARSSLSSKLQGASCVLRLLPFNELELRGMERIILARPGQPETSESTLDFS